MEDRGFETMTSAEFGAFVYEQGYCASKEYWMSPVFSEFEYFKPTGSIHFAFEQVQKAGLYGFKKNVSGVISKFDERAHFSTCVNENEVFIHYLKVGDVAFFAKLGFKFPNLQYVTH